MILSIIKIFIAAAIVGLIFGANAYAHGGKTCSNFNSEFSRILYSEDMGVSVTDDSGVTRTFNLTDDIPSANRWIADIDEEIVACVPGHLDNEKPTEITNVVKLVVRRASADTGNGQLDKALMSTSGLQAFVLCHEQGFGCKVGTKVHNGIHDSP